MIRPTDPDFETAVEAERDLQVLAFVFDVAAATQRTRSSATSSGSRWAIRYYHKTTAGIPEAGTFNLNCSSLRFARMPA